MMKLMPRPGIEPGPKASEAFVMSFSLPGRLTESRSISFVAQASGLRQG